MKKEFIKDIRNKGWWIVYTQFKDQYTMKEIADIFGVNFNTFYRIIKLFENKKVEGKK